MFITPLSEYPLVRGGKTERAGEWDAASTLHVSTVVLPGEERIRVYYKGQDDHPVNSGVSQLGVGFLYPDGYDDETDGVRIPFNGREITLSGSNPLLDPTTLAFPLNADESLGAGIGEVNFEQDTVGGLYGYWYITNHQTDSKNHVGVIQSADGISWSFVQEMLTPTATNQGTQIEVQKVGSDYWFTYGLGGGGKALRHSSNGLTYTEDFGKIVDVPTDAGDIAAGGFPGPGRLFHYGDYLYYVLQGTRGSNGDWPEAMLLYRCHVDDLGNGELWEEYHSPINLRPPCYGGIWQANLIQTNNGWWAIHNAWGEPGFHNINSTYMNDLRTTQYAHLGDDFGYKHILAGKVTSSVALTDWYYHPLEDGETYRFRSNGGWLALAEDGENVIVKAEADADCNWVVEKQNKFWLIKPEADTTKAIRMTGLDARSNARYLPLVVETFSPTDSTLNFRYQWHFSLHGDDTPTQASIVNRYSSLSMRNDPERGVLQDVHMVGTPDIWHIEAVS